MKTRKILSLLLALCLFLTLTPVTAEDPTVEVTTEGGETIVTVETGEIDGTTGYGIEVFPGQEETGVPLEIQIDGTALVLPDDLDSVDKLIIDADSVTEETGVVSSDGLIVDAVGISAELTDTDLELTVGDVEVQVDDSTKMVEEEVPLEEDTTEGGDPEEGGDSEEDDERPGAVIHAVGVYLDLERGNSSVSTGDVTVNIAPEDDYSYAYGEAYGGYVLTKASENGGLPDGAEPGENAIEFGDIEVALDISTSEPILDVVGLHVYADEDIKTDVQSGSVTVSATATSDVFEDNYIYNEGDNPRLSVIGIEADSGVTVKAGDVVAQSTVEEGNAWAIADGLSARGDAVIQADSVTAEASSEKGNALAKGIQNDYCGSVAVKGDVSVKASSGGEDTEESATGIDIVTGYQTSETIDVQVGGNVTAEGKNGEAIFLAMNDNGDDVSVTVGGTIAGDDIAIDVDVRYENFSVEDVDIAVWEAKENEDGEIARVVTKGEVDKEASAELEASINYIVKFTTEFMFKDITTDKGNTVTLLDKEYHTANEDENVYFVVTEDDEHILDGVFYNEDDKSTLIQASNLKKTDGKYTIAMARGGAMKLGIKWHEHEYTNYTDDGNATCGKDGTETGTCSCGAKNTRTKPGSATGKHTEDTKTRRENYVAPTETAEGGYDEVTVCKDCGAEISRVHVTIQKSEPSAPDPPAPVPPAPVPVVVNTALHFQLVPKTDELVALRNALQKAETNGDIKGLFHGKFRIIGFLDPEFTRILGSVAATLTGDKPNAGRVTVTLDPNEKEPAYNNGTPGEPWIRDLPKAGASLQLLIVIGNTVYVLDAKVSVDGKIELPLDMALIDTIYGRTFTIVVLAEP